MNEEAFLVGYMDKQAIADPKYPDAGEGAMEGVQKDIEEFKKQSPDEQSEKPLLYQLIGSDGTPPYKMDRSDVDYKVAVGKEKCANCVRAYENVVSEKYICSWVRGEIRLKDWCNKWADER